MRGRPDRPGLRWLGNRGGLVSAVNAACVAAERAGACRRSPRDDPSRRWLAVAVVASGAASRRSHSRPGDWSWRVLGRRRSRPGDLGTLGGYLRTVVAQPLLSHAGHLPARPGSPPVDGATPLTWPDASPAVPENCGSGISDRSRRQYARPSDTTSDLGFCGGRCWVRTNVG
jgi:hypothetical protein